jgi:CheY-like chemotaxis protein
MVRELIADALRAAGYTVIAASTGEEAIRMAEANARPIALLVTDVVMPGMSGVKLAELLRASGRVTRAIYMSGYTEATISPQGVEPERAVFLSKPFSTDVLLQKVREVLDTAGE